MAGVFLAIVVLIKWLAIGTILFMILLCSWIGVCLNRHPTDVKKEESRSDEKNTKNCEWERKI
jgi:hypothetical protein